MEKLLEKVCSCEIHLKNDPENKTIPCVGHGAKCPCVIKVQVKQQDEKKQEADK